MPEINFDTFQRQKDSLVWQQVLTWKKGVGAVRHLVWRGFPVKDGAVVDIPAYFAYVSVNDENGTVGMALAANVRFDPVGRGQKVIDNFTAGNQSEISDQFLIDLMHQRYGMRAVDFTKMPVAKQVGSGTWKPDSAVTKAVLRHKTMINKADRLLASLFLRKISFTRLPPKYKVEAVIVPSAESLAEHKEDYKSLSPRDDVKSANADFSGLERQFAVAGFVETFEAPEWANEGNWDFELGLSADSAKKMRQSFEKVLEEYKESDLPPDEDDDDEIFTASSGLPVRMSQDVSQYYTGPLPDASQLQQYVGTPNLDASQIKTIFGGVDEALSLVNQFDSSLLLNVAFIYNFMGGGAYGVYMSALDEKIKNEELKRLLKMAGYALQDAPDGSFYATHPQKSSEEIDREIKAYRDKIGSSGATTFGIDMNKVLNAARLDCQEGNITDPQDQYMLGVLHLGATMAHEAVHSKGSQSEGPSEDMESKFMAWALPIINQRRLDRFKSQGKEQEYAPLIVNPSQRRMASVTWLARAAADGVIDGVEKRAQYGAQFLHSQNFMTTPGPQPWAGMWNTGPIEAMLDKVRPVRRPISKLNMEGQLREMNKDKWTSIVDAKSIAEELLEANRSPLQAYRITEHMIEDSREKPLMLPVKKRLKTASYDSGKDAFGWMCNLDLPMEDRVQRFDDNDEETTWFDAKFIRNQSRYKPEYGNPMSKERDIYYWFKEPRFEPTRWDDAMEERPWLKTSPFRRAASADEGHERGLLGILQVAARDILSGKILGTRFVSSTSVVPLVRRFYENDIDLKITQFDADGLSAVWVTAESVSDEDIGRAEEYVTGRTDDDQAWEVFERITCVDKVKSDAISTVIETVRAASKDAGLGSMAVLGDLPLIVALDGDRTGARTIDFCSDDPDACVKIGELVCDRLGALSYVDERSGMLVAKWRCATFRFCGGAPTDAAIQLASGIDCKPTFLNAEVCSRGITPLMLALDVATEKVLDPTGEALPDVEARVVRMVCDPAEALLANPLLVFDAIFVASRCGFSIDSKIGEAARTVGSSDDAMAACMDLIRSVGKGKVMSAVEEYDIGGLISKTTGG